MFKINILFFTLVCQICYFSALAQLTIEKQTDMPLSKAQQDFEVINIDKKGMLLFLEKPNQSVLITHYDTSLQVSWQQEYPLHFQLARKPYSISKHQIHFFANRQDSVYQIVTINLSNGDATLSNCTNSLDIYNNHFEISYFLALEDAFVFGGQNEQGKPAVLYYHKSKQAFKVLPNVNYLKSKLVEITSNEEEKVFSVLLMHKGDIFYHVYDEEGKLLGNHVVRPESKASEYKNYYFNEGKTFLKDKQQQYIVGTYATSSLILNAQGIYVVSFVNHEHQKTSFYSFNHFQNFHNHLDSMKKEKVMAKIRDKGSYKYDYEITVGELQALETQLLLSLKVSKKNYNNASAKNINAKKHPILRSGKFDKPQEGYMASSPVVNMETTPNSRRPKIETTNPIFYETRSFFLKKDTTSLATRSQANAFYLYYNTVYCVLDNMGNLLWDNLFDESHFAPNFSTNTPSQKASAIGFKNGQISNLQLFQNQLFLHKLRYAIPSQEIYKVSTPIGYGSALELQEKVCHWFADRFLYWKVISEQNKNGISFKIKILKMNFG